MATRVKIDPPNQLPSSGISSIQYKQWKIALKIYLQQTPVFREFYPGGLYTQWTPLEDNPHRILQLATNDKPEGDQNDDAAQAEHLAQRRISLETFLGIIARYSDEGDFDDIMEKSSSLDSIFALHERRYGLQKKGRYFNRIDSIRFDKATMSDYHKFYTDLRSCFKSNLMKAGDTVKSKNNQVLSQDEKISPTTECLLVYMAMERIDPRLPSEIDRIFGHRMDDKTTLFDLQTEIFSFIPKALEEMDRKETELNAYHVNRLQSNQEDEAFNQTQHEPGVSALYGRPYQQNSRMNMRSNPKQTMKPRFQNNNFNRFSVKVCKLCQALELPPSVVNSHNTEQCRKKNQLQQIDLQEQLQQLQMHEAELEDFENEQD